jgi:hypothetical protein
MGVLVDACSNAITSTSSSTSTISTVWSPITFNLNRYNPREAGPEIHAPSSTASNTLEWQAQKNTG